MRALLLLLLLTGATASACSGSSQKGSTPVGASATTRPALEATSLAATQTPTFPSATAAPPTPSQTPREAPTAITTPTPAPLVSPTSTPVPDLSFSFGDDVSVFERTLIITAIEVTRELLGGKTQVLPPVTVFAYTSTQDLAQAFSTSARAQSWRATTMAERLQPAVAEASYRDVAIHVRGPAWQQLSDTERMRAVSHEYVHVIQLENTGLAIADATLRALPDKIPPAGPFWLIEGSAEVVSMLVTDELDLGNYAGRLADLGIAARGNPVPLSKIETYFEYVSSGREGLARAVLATDYLLRNRDLSELFNYWRDIGRGATWQEAFVRRFGLSPEAFYTAFDAYYANTFAR